MTLSIVQQEDSSPVERLLAAIRPEFRVDRYWPDPDDPSLCQPVCRLEWCKSLRYRPSQKGSGLCANHHRIWVHLGRPEDWFPEPFDRGRRVPDPDEGWLRSVTMFTCQTCGIEFPPARRDRNRPRKFCSRRCANAAASLPDIGCLDTSALQGVAKLELQYFLQDAHDSGRHHVGAAEFRTLVRVRATSGVTLFTDLDSKVWEQRVGRAPKAGRLTTSVSALARHVHACLEAFYEDRSVEAELQRDVWRGAIIAADDPLWRGNLYFRMPQVWFREMAKRWCRLRLPQTKCSTMRTNIDGLNMFAAYLAERHPDVTGWESLQRSHLEDYIALVMTSAFADTTKCYRINTLGSFLTAIHERGYAPELPRTTVIYPEDTPKRRAMEARGLSAHVMAQLLDPKNLDKLDSEVRRYLLIIIKTGLRGGDAGTLRFNCLTQDGSGSPVLLYQNNKMNREASRPISTEVSELVTAQQRHVLDRFPNGSPWLFPARIRNQDGRYAAAQKNFNRLLRIWLQDCQVKDEYGQPATVTPHRFRHTLGTEMINNGTPQHVVQRLLDHDSPAMTAHYARLNDQTLRREFESYQQRVRITGEIVAISTEPELADAEWMKERLSRAKLTLPNGYCGRPLQQKCPHPNACLTCGDFLTTVEFLPLHREQLAKTRKLIATAESNGQFRLVEMNREIEANLGTLVSTLEDLGEG